MMELKTIFETIEKPVSGEWGIEPSKGSIIKVLRNTNFSNDGSLNLKDVVEREISISKIAQKKLNYGDILIEKSGGSPAQPVGRVVFFDQTEGEYLFSNFTSLLRPKKGIFPKYLFYLLYGNHLFKKTLSYQNKTTGILNLQLEKYLKETKIPIPSLTDQQCITTILDHADSIRRKNRQILEKYNELAQSVFYEMFGDPVRNEKGWPYFELKTLGKISTGSTPSSSKSDMFGGNIPFVTPGDLDLDIPYKRFVTIAGSKHSRIVTEGALFVCCIGATIGKTRMAKEICAFNQQINAVQWNTLVTPLFGLNAFRFVKREVINKAISTTLPILKKSEFEKIKMAVPPINIQNRFSEIILDIEKQKELTQKSLEKSEDLFQSLLQRAFKGEL
ncbi:MAG: restriction endonuclease subunit S [Bacteroidales bacterium]